MPETAHLQHWKCPIPGTSSAPGKRRQSPSVSTFHRCLHCADTFLSSQYSTCSFQTVCEVGMVTSNSQDEEPQFEGSSSLLWGTQPTGVGARALPPPTRSPPPPSPPPPQPPRTGPPAARVCILSSVQRWRPTPPNVPGKRRGSWLSHCIILRSATHISFGLTRKHF